MLTIGRSNYMRFNHPAEAKLMKSVLPNPRISMAPINFEPDNSFQSKFNKKPPVAPRRSPRESLSDSGSEEPPDYKKSISPKVFPSNVVTVNMPVKDVLGKDLHSLSKNLPQSALNYAELNYTEKNNSLYNEKHQVKAPGQQIFSKKTLHQSQYVNVTVNETKNINNRVIIFENGCAPKNQNVSFDHNELNNRDAGSEKNVNLSREHHTSPASNVAKTEHRRSGSLGELTNANYGEGRDELAQRKYEAELRRNQAQQDRIKEQEIEKAEQQRLEEILSMCAEYEKQSQCEKNKPITPNRIKTNGSLPRDKRGQFGPPSPSYTTPPPSPLDILHNELLKQKNHHNYENVNIAFSSPREINTMHYENVEIKPQGNTIRRVPTLLHLERELGPLLPQTKIMNKTREDRKKLEQLRKEKKDIMAVISRIKRQMAEIEIQEEELHRELVERELQREILELTKRIDSLKSQINDLDQQKLDTSKTNTNEFKTIQKQKMECMIRLEEIRNRLKCIDNELLTYSNEESEQEVSSDTDSDKSKELEKHLSNMSLNKMTNLSCSVIISNSKIPSDQIYNMSQSFNEKLLHEKSILEEGMAKSFPVKDDIDRISKVTSSAPINIDEGQGSLGRKTIESLKGNRKETTFAPLSTRFASDRTRKAASPGFKTTGTRRSKNQVGTENAGLQFIEFFWFRRC
ncbi:hypothetical protein NQ318_010368 [Aromia moschata]|uniref:Uncharacterized protein n=1 Tax=Aromia moschata TaxID=1265417 RepID=A0AAV8XSW3_9CUCU|nr:hypothetical protein NQ318_010368 [Aromia moschata]